MGQSLDRGTMNEAWTKHFGGLRTLNIGIGGDKTQNVLWRLDHGGVEGIDPRVTVLMIGNNNMFFTPETGIEAAARGIQECVTNLRGKFPGAPVIVAKILPAHAPGARFYEDIQKTNAALDLLKLDSDPKVHLLDLTSDFLNADGSLKKDLYTPDSIHLSLAGYGVYAERLRPLLERLLPGKKLATAGDSGAPVQDVTRPRFLLLNYATRIDSVDQAGEMMTYIRERFGAANRESMLRVGLAIIYTPGDRLADHVKRMQKDLELAQRMQVPC